MVVEEFLENKQVKLTKKLSLLKKFQLMGVNMSMKIHFLHSHVRFCSKPSHVIELFEIYTVVALQATSTEFGFQIMALYQLFVTCYNYLKKFWIVDDLIQ